MLWADIRRTYPNQWLILEVLASHTEDRVIVPDRLAVVESCADASGVMPRYGALRREYPSRFLCFGHTSRPTLEFEELFWAGVHLGAEA
jgi:hypothetical protein